ncbi:hypothetical protein GBAR_LOCUS25354, partial [Geodia barretti]
QRRTGNLFCQNFVIATSSVLYCIHQHLKRTSLQPGLEHASFSLPCPVVLGTLSDYLQIRGGHPHYHTHLVPASSHRVV